MDADLPPQPQGPSPESREALPPPAHRSASARSWRTVPGWLWGVIVVLGLGAAFLSVICVVLVAVAAGMAGGMARLPLQEQVVREGTGSAKIIQIDIHGIILSDAQGLFMAAVPYQSLLAQLEQARKDPYCKGVLLRINSPGGGITASDVIYDQIRRLRRAGKKVVALYEDVAASGAVYLSAQADFIVAHPTTLTGSIGVIIHSWDASVLMQKIGLRDQSIKSGERKDLLTYTRPMKADERKILEDLTGQMHERFIQIVAAGRGMSVEKLRPLADGRIYSASQAQQHGLIDSVGYYELAVEKARALAGAPDAPVVRYLSPSSLLRDLLGAEAPFGQRAPEAGLHQTLRALIGELMTTRLMYLWRPGW